MRERERKRNSQTYINVVTLSLSDTHTSEHSILSTHSPPLSLSLSSHALANIFSLSHTNTGERAITILPFSHVLLLLLVLWSLTTFYIPYVCFIAEEVKHIFRFFQTKRRSRALNNSRESRLWFKISHFFRMIFRMSFQRGYCVPPCRGRRPISVQKK